MVDRHTSFSWLSQSSKRGRNPHDSEHQRGLYDYVYFQASNLSFETHFEALIGVSSFLRCCLGALVTIQAVGSLVQFNDSLPAYYLSLRLLDTRIVKSNCILFFIAATISNESIQIKSGPTEYYPLFSPAAEESWETLSF